MRIRRTKRWYPGLATTKVLVRMIRQAALVTIGFLVATIALVSPSASGAIAVDETFGQSGFRYIDGVGGTPMVQVDTHGRIVVSDGYGLLSRVVKNGEAVYPFNNRLPGRRSFDYSSVIEPVLRNGDAPLLGVNGGLYSDDGSACGDRFLLSQFREDGKVDGSFFDAGLLQTSAHRCSGERSVDALLATSNDTTVVAGGRNVESQGTRLLARATVRKLDRNGDRLRSFGKRGVVALPKNPIKGRYSETVDIEKTGGGKILALAYLNNRLSMFRVNARGKFDKSFSGDGIAYLPARSSSTCVDASYCGYTNRLALTDQGTVYAATEAKVGRELRRVVVAVQANGSLRRSFGGEGKVDLSEVTDAAGGFQPADIASTSDGGAILVGNIGVCETPCKWAGESDDQRRGALVKLTKYGEVDRSIGTNGVLVFPGINRLTSIEPQDSAYIVAGTDYGSYLGEDAWLPDESYVAWLSVSLESGSR